MVFIIIFDVNDYFLVFQLDQYIIFVKEDVVIGIFLVSLIIIDIDQGI